MSINSSHTAIVAANHAALDAFLALFTTSLNSIEKISSHNFSSARHVLAAPLEDSGSLPVIRNLPEVIAQQTALLKPRIEKAIAYSQGIQQISTEAQEEFIALLERQQAEFNKSLASLIDWYAGSTTNAQGAVAVVKSAISAANTAFENASKAARQVSDIAKAGLSATAQAVSAANQAGTASPRKKAA